MISSLFFFVRLLAAWCFTLFLVVLATTSGGAGIRTGSC